MMDSTLGTDSQDSDDLVPPGITASEYDAAKIKMPTKNLVCTPSSSPGTTQVSSKGIENAKKRLRAFSIQKKSPLSAITVPKPISSGSTTVLIGKLSSLKATSITPKVDLEGDLKKPPKPPKPGCTRSNVLAYSKVQKRTLSEIEAMKRKMELIELGIPLGLICPTSTSDTVMPTKAMPPIKTFLERNFRKYKIDVLHPPRIKSVLKSKRNHGNDGTHPSKVDELIREAKKAKADGKEFKFDYHKILPDYDNPFQRKKDEEKKDEESDIKEDTRKDNRKSDRRFSDKYDRNDKYKDDRNKHREKGKDYHELKKGDVKMKKDGKETDVNLNDYLVCDSWSLDNEDKTASPSLDIATKVNQKIKDRIRDTHKDDSLKSQSYSSKPTKMERLKPVIDSFKFEIDPNEDEGLDVFDKNCRSGKFTKRESKKDLYDSPIDMKLFDYDHDMSKDGVIDANDDNFLESVINEIKQENMSDDTSQDKGLVEYDSPKDDDDDYDSKFDTSQGSVTPELDDRMRDLQSSQQSHYSDGYRSTDSYKSIESGYKSTESGYKSTEIPYKPADSSYKSTESGYKPSKSNYKSPDREYKSKDGRRRSDSRQSDSRQSDSYRSSVEKEIDVALMPKMSKSTVDSLETWSFVLKICQPILFRHDKNKCYKETQTNPKLWYTVNPKACNCVKDRSVVYEELEMCKMGLVDRVYGCDQIPDGPCPPARAWYPRLTGCTISAQAPQMATDWETDDLPPRSTTPQQTDEMCIDQEYQRFMKALWPDMAEAQTETSRSTTPIQEESRKKKKLDDPEKDAEDKKKAKKLKLSSEGWSQESDLEDETEKKMNYLIQMSLPDELFCFSPPPLDTSDKRKKIKTGKDKNRKRKRSTSLSSANSESEEESKTKRKLKKKENKKTKEKSTKRRRVSKKIKKKLKDKQKKRKKIKEEKISEESEEEEAETKKEKKLKRKKQLKLKRAEKKKKLVVKSSSSSSSSSTSSSSDSESEVEKKKKIKKKDLVIKKKKKDKKKKRKESIDSTQSEDLFDVNILNNIKTERLTDDEKNQQMNDFSPRRQKPREREIINVKELQNDFVGNNILIKQEKEEGVTESNKGDETVHHEVEFNLSDIPKPEDHVVDSVTEVKPHVEEVKLGPSIVNLPSTIPLPEEIQLPKSIDVSMIPEPVPVPVAVSIPVPLQSPVPVAVSAPVHVPVAGAVPVPVPLPLTVPVSVSAPVHVPVSASVPVPVPLPLPVHVSVSAPVPVPEPILDPVPVPAPEPPVTQEIVKPNEVKLMPQNLSYCNHDVSSQHELYSKGMEETEDKFEDNFVQDYEMYEQMAMAYQSDVAKQLTGVEPCSGGRGSAAQRIETVVRLRGEIKCDWRAGDSPAAQQQSRPSRWGLKPGEVNIVLTGGPTVEPVPPPEQFPIRSVVEPVYRIESLGTRHDSNNASNVIGYDEAYLDTYGASDLLQYGDCFASEQQIQRKMTDKKMELEEASENESQRISTLDERIDQALRRTILGDVAKDPDDKEAEKEFPEKGILVTKSLATDVGRSSKRVSFADGYKPGQDSDVEEPPVKRKKRARRYGCAWPCPATHADHVPLWDALPPPPPPPPRHSPPPAPASAPPLHLLRPPPRAPLLKPPMHALKFDPNAAIPAFMPPEPPPGLISFQ